MIFHTIVAPITASGGAIAVVRVSGELAKDIAQKAMPSYPENLPAKVAHYGKFAHGDDGYAILFDESASYTGEDSAEFFIHGSGVSIAALMEICLNAGCRLAEPGEFTLRAFLNGRVDLSQAEAVLDAVSATSKSMLSASVDQTLGSLNHALSEPKKEIEVALTAIEAWVDFSEEIGELDTQKIIDSLLGTNRHLSKIFQVSKAAKMVRDGFTIAIIGEPNVGKSSLFNALLKSNRAIVTDIAGTTRDYLSEPIQIGENQCLLIDTAGLRDSDNLIEAEGIERTKKLAQNASLVLALHLASAPPQLPNGLNLNEKSILFVGTKSDLTSDPQENAISTLTGAGLDGLVKRIEARINTFFPQLPYFPSVRQSEKLASSIANVDLAVQSLKNDVPLDLASTYLRAASHDLGLITGESANEDILHQIFSRFCIGK